MDGWSTVRRRLRLASTCVCAALAGGGMLRGQPSNGLTVVAPTNLANADSAFGSGTLSSVLRMQEVYGAVHFPTGGLLITELRFRPDSSFGYAFTGTVASISISLSTTEQPPDGLHEAFEQNVGADVVEVFSGALDLSSQFTGPPNGPKDFDIVVPLTRGFLYAPAAGNLLLDLRNFSGGPISPLSGEAVADDAASRMIGEVDGLYGTADTGAEALQVVYFATNAPPLPPPTIKRGPYLQLGTSSNIVVRWRTNRGTDSRVQFGLEANALVWEVSDAAPTAEHIVTLTNLAAETRYYYAVGTTETNLAGGPSQYFFTAPPGPKATRIWAIGDSGTANQPGYGGLQAAVRDAYYAFTGARHTDVWLMLGDNAYYSGSDEQYQQTVFDIYPALLRTTPVWPTIGNHDVLTLGGQPYKDIFTLPMNGEAGGVASGTESYYSFDFGGVHFVCLDSESSVRAPGGAMLTWLEQDLAANTNGWVIAFWHSPPYTFGTHNSDNYFDTAGHLVEMRSNAVPVLESYGVDLVLCGHSHNYERSYLLDGHYGYSSSLTPEMVKDEGSGRPGDTGAYLKPTLGPAAHEGAVYVVCGSSGWVTPDLVQRKHPAMFVKIRQLGSMVIDVNSNRLDAVFLRETGAIDDHFTMIKGVGPEPLRIATFRVNNGTVKAQWKSVAGWKYRVYWTQRLENPDWQPASVEITATGATTTWSDAAPADAGKAFYKVAEAP